MTPPAGLPSEPQVRQAFTKLVEQARHNGHRPSVLALARQFGLSNTTFPGQVITHAPRRHAPVQGTQSKSTSHRQWIGGSRLSQRARFTRSRCRLG